MFKRFLKIALFIPTLALASECPQLYHTPFKAENTIEFCKSFFVVVYDDTKDRPIFSSERIDHSLVRHDIDLSRIKFYDENDPRVSYDEKHHPDNYDRGHLTPASDTVNEKQFHDTFTYINTVPQNPSINRGVWRVLEDKVRHIAVTRDKPTIIVTGGIYGDDDNIPIMIYKIVFANETKAYLVDNHKGAKVRETTVNIIEKLTQLELDGL